MGLYPQTGGVLSPVPLSSEYGTYKTVKAGFWPWRSGECPSNLVCFSLLARKQEQVSTRGVSSPNDFLGGQGCLPGSEVSPRVTRLAICCLVRGQQMPSPSESGPLRAVHLSRHKWTTLIWQDGGDGGDGARAHRREPRRVARSPPGPLDIPITSQRCEAVPRRARI